ncbi:serine/Arginine-related protein 53 isoform X2 [Sarcophilus harrisii]|uniref:serine/Arginine-related protein 53 isoform X2 n=1 Tax=Sarcophilus harrisii TaxID=9305 RepID=UPI001301B1D0|nr:serine/Arginine-related protein 53 isoform X2 [Sarcophilus harrisii]
MGRRSSDTEEESRSKRKKKHRRRSSSSSSSESRTFSRKKTGRKSRSKSRSWSRDLQPRSHSYDRRRRHRSSSSSSYGSRRKRSRSRSRGRGKSYRSQRSRSKSRTRRSRSRPRPRSHSRSSERSSHRRTRSRSRERERRKGREKEKREKERERGKEKELHSAKRGDSGNIKAGLEHLPPAEQAKARLQLVLEAADQATLGEQVKRVKEIEAIESDCFIQQTFRSSKEVRKQVPALRVPSARPGNEQHPASQELLTRWEMGTDAALEPQWSTSEEQAAREDPVRTSGKEEWREAIWSERQASQRKGETRRTPAQCPAARDDPQTDPRPVWPEHKGHNTRHMNEPTDPSEGKQEPVASGTVTADPPHVEKEIEPSSIPTAIKYQDDNSLAHPNLFIEKAEAEEKWFKRLIALRQERLMGSPVA